MSLFAYLTVTGQKHGRIEGGVSERGREGQILVFGVVHQIVAPRDPVSGVPTGKRAHKPLAVLKALDPSSPLLHQALTSNEILPSCVLTFYTPSAEGFERPIYRVTLTDATICAIRFHMLNTRRPQTRAFPLYEEVQFTYRRIDWEYLQPSIVASDDWRQPR